MSSAQEGLVRWGSHGDTPADAMPSRSWAGTSMIHYGTDGQPGDLGLSPRRVVARSPAVWDTQSTVVRPRQSGYFTSLGSALPLGVEGGSNHDSPVKNADVAMGTVGAQEAKL